MNYLIFFLLMIVGSILLGMELGLENQLKIRKNFKRAIMIITILWIIVNATVISTFEHKYLFVYYGLDLFLFFFGVSFVVMIFVRGGIIKEEKTKPDWIPKYTNDLGG